MIFCKIVNDWNKLASLDTNLDTFEYTHNIHVLIYVNLHTININRSDPTSVIKCIVQIRIRSILYKSWPGHTDVLRVIDFIIRAMRYSRHNTPQNLRLVLCEHIRVIFGKANKSWGSTRLTFYSHATYSCTMLRVLRRNESFRDRYRQSQTQQHETRRLHTHTQHSHNLLAIWGAWFFFSFAPLCTWIFVSNIFYAVRCGDGKRTLEARRCSRVARFRVRCRKKHKQYVHYVVYCAESWWVVYLVAESDYRTLYWRARARMRIFLFRDRFERMEQRAATLLLSV